MAMAERMDGLLAARIRAGRWEGELHRPGAAAPVAELWLGSQCLGPVEVAPGASKDTWLLAAPVPAGVLSDGVQTFLIRASGTDETLAHFAILAGEAVEADLRAEIDLLRAEIELLKTAFRRHCAGG